MKERMSMNYQDNEALSVKIANGDLSGVRMTGQSIDRIYKNGVLVDEIIGHNLVVNSFANLVMCLLKRDPKYSGIKYWAIGSGSPSWDTTEIKPSATEERLTAEIYRVPIEPSDITFINPDYSESETPTNILQIKHTFDKSDCIGTWREFGLFGGDATETKNSGIMINKRHHTALPKTDEMSI